MSFRIGSGIHKVLYKATRVGIGSRSGGLHFLLLTTIGRKTGRKHTVPLQHFLDSDKTVVVASKGGSEDHPWYLYLRSNPQVVVQIKKSKISMSATTAIGEERKRLWMMITSRYGDTTIIRKRQGRFPFPPSHTDQEVIMDQELADIPV